MAIGQKNVVQSPYIFISFSILHIALTHAKVEFALTKYKAHHGITWQTKDYEAKCNLVAN